MTPRKPLHLFEGFGVEIEYMIVDAATLDVLPVSDRVLTEVAGELTGEVDLGPLSWSNELVLHVLELKTNGPAATLDGLAALFQGDVCRANALLGPMGGRLLPTAAHPWMDPFQETRLWPHDYSVVYEAFNRIFDCRGHGWANLQSVHLNLPFANDDEFGRLHAAIRVLLPLLPALAASSPYLDGTFTGFLDARMDTYKRNAARVPSVSGAVIPEQAFSRADYDRLIFAPMYQDIAPLDLGGILQEEWLNARGAIARFDRHAIEIRVLDVQENPAADLAILTAIVGVLQGLVQERWASYAEQQRWPIDALRPILDATIRDAEAAALSDPVYLSLFGYTGPVPCTAGQLWRHLVDAVVPAGHLSRPPLEVILTHGTLARRILRATPTPLSPQGLQDVYTQLARSLANGTPFLPHPTA